jgi:ubiquitin-protein ligase
VGCWGKVALAGCGVKGLGDGGICVVGCGVRQALAPGRNPTLARNLTSDCGTDVGLWADGGAQEGMDKFLETHKCNDICRYLQLPSTGRFKPQAPGATVVPATRPSARAEQPPQPPPRVPNAEIAATRQLLCVKEEEWMEIEAKAEQLRKEQDAHRLKREWENQQRNNTAQNAMVFAQPRFPDSAQGLREWVGVILGPEGSVYEGGAFQVSMSFGDEYPLKPPSVKFVTQIFHPNVWGEPDDRQGEICLDIFKDNWSRAMRVETTLLSLVALLEEPNGNSALWPFAGQMYQKDRAMFDRYAREWVQTHAFKAQDISNAHSKGYPTTKIVAALRQENLDFDKALNLLFDEVAFRSHSSERARERESERAREQESERARERA